LGYNRDEVTKSLELLLESLIKMVGKANQKVDHLQKRVIQLEWMLKEEQLLNKEKPPKNLMFIHPKAQSNSARL
jgi:hypothetical protein